jgi:hypothetical protein
MEEMNVVCSQRPTSTTPKAKVLHCSFSNFVNPIIKGFIVMHHTLIMFKSETNSISQCQNTAPTILV